MTEAMSTAYVRRLGTLIGRELITIVDIGILIIYSLYDYSISICNLYRILFPAS